MTMFKPATVDHPAREPQASERDISLKNRLLVSVFVPFLLCLSLPLEIYNSNIDQMPFPYSAILKNSVFVFLGLSLIFFLVIQLAGRFRQTVANLLLSLALCAWISSSFISPNYGVFNGTDLTIDILSKPAIAECLLWLSIIAVVLFVPKLSKIIWEGATFLLFLIVIVTVFRTYQAIDAGPSTRQAILSLISLASVENQYWQELPFFSKERNILHILLDEAQGSVVRSTLENHPEIKNKLQGFYLFEDTAGVFPYTAASVPAIFSGEVYDNKVSKVEYMKDALGDNAFFSYLDDSGYSRIVHTHPSYCATTYLDNCSGVPLMSEYSAFLTLLDFALLRATPQSASSILYFQSAGVSSRVLGDGAYQETTTGVAWLNFNEFSTKVEVKDIPPTYKFFQSLISHAPLVLDANCDILPATAKNQLGPMITQMRCSFHMVTQLLSKLDTLGILDRTLVIVSSDHGGNYVNNKHKALLRKRNIVFSDFSRADAMLMVKPFNARQPMKVLDAPAQLNQIGALIQLLDRKNADIDDVVEWLALQPHHRRFNSILPVHDGDELIRFRSYCIRGPVSKPASWQKLRSGADTRCGNTVPKVPPL